MHFGESPSWKACCEGFFCRNGCRLAAREENQLCALRKLCVEYASVHETIAIKKHGLGVYVLLEVAIDLFAEGKASPALCKVCIAHACTDHRGTKGKPAPPESIYARHT